MSYKKYNFNFKLKQTQTSELNGKLKNLLETSISILFFTQE